MPPELVEMTEDEARELLELLCIEMGIPHPTELSLNLIARGFVVALVRSLQANGWRLQRPPH